MKSQPSQHLHNCSLHAWCPACNYNIVVRHGKVIAVCKFHCLLPTSKSMWKWAKKIANRPHKSLLLFLPRAPTMEYEIAEVSYSVALPPHICSCSLAPPPTTLQLSLSHLCFSVPAHSHHLLLPPTLAPSPPCSLPLTPAFSCLTVCTSWTYDGNCDSWDYLAKLWSHVMAYFMAASLITTVLVANAGVIQGLACPVISLVIYTVS